MPDAAVFACGMTVGAVVVALVAGIHIHRLEAELTNARETHTIILEHNAWRHTDTTCLEAEGK